MKDLAAAEAGEAKQRRAALPSEQGRFATDLVAAADIGLTGHADSSDKGRRSWAGTLRAGAARARRRLDDMIATSMLWSAWILGYLYATEELLQPPGAPVVQLMSLVCHALFGLAILSWAGVVWHGPGRVAGEGQASQLPPAIVAALAVGRFSRDHAFGPENSWCGACELWKPPLAHHCSICGRCGLWMDHHCNFAMQCVGFRNLRCFLVMLFYTQVLCFSFVPLVVRRCLIEPGLDKLTTAWLLAFCMGWYGLMRFVRYFSRTIIAKTSAGWPSHVLLVKYKGIFDLALETAKEQVERQKAGVAAPHLEPLQELLRRLRRRGGVRGFLRAGDLVGSLVLVFGEPLSWRWLLPLRPGGSGDPLQPTVFDAKVCEDWASLAQLLKECNAVVAADQRVCEQAVNLWSNRIQALLAGAEKLTSTGSPDFGDPRGRAAPSQAAVPPAMAPPREGVTMA